MILVDNSQILFASVFSQFATGADINDPINVVRHITLNTYRFLKEKFSSEYGDLVICQDSYNYWRKEYFPYYKANRKKTREQNQEHWDAVFAAMKQINDEIAENMPYKNIKIDRCEADDIIAVLAKHYCPIEKVVIVSNDKDFQQLLRFNNVSLYSPQKKSMVKCPNPDGFLFEQIVRGDASDGIPNILSDADTFVDEAKRQKPLTAKRFKELQVEIPDSNKEFFERNKILIDLNYIPTEYVDSILDEYKKPIQNKNKMFNYFVEHKLTNLMKDMATF